MTTETAPAGIGHNQPPAIDIAGQHQSRAEDLIANANKWANERAEITDDETAGAASDFVEQLRGHAKKVKASSDGFKKELREEIKGIGELFDPIIDTMKISADAIKALLAPWLQAEQDRVDAEKAAKAKAAREAQEAADQKALEAATADTDAVTAKIDSAVADKEAKKATKEAAAAPSRAGAKGHYGARAMGLRKPWTFEIEDETAIPREWLKIDESKIGQAVRRKDDPIRDIPGVRIFQKSTVA